MIRFREVIFAIEPDRRVDVVGFLDDGSAMIRHGQRWFSVAEHGPALTATEVGVDGSTRFFHHHDTNEASLAGRIVRLIAGRPLDVAGDYTAEQSTTIVGVGRARFEQRRLDSRSG